MKHPQAEEWMSWLYGEAEPAQRLDLEAHLAVCPECRDRVERWRSTMGELDRAAGPRVEAPRPSRWSPVLLRLAASVVLLGVGVAAGRMMGMGPEEVDRRVHAATAAVRREMEAERDAALAQVVADTRAAVRAENQVLITELARRLEQARAQDRAQVVGLMRELDRRRERELALVRGGLGNLAEQAGEAIAFTQHQVRSLAEALPTVPGSTDSDRN